MSMNTARRLSILLVTASLGLAAPAFAGEPTAADSESALQLYKEGKAMREGGDQQGALAKLKAAYALVQTPITAIELGKTQIALGLLVEAREVLLSVPRIPVRTNESTKAAEARVESEALAAELRPRLASITVRPKGATDGPPKISVDGVVVPPDAATVPRVVNPGAHVVVVEANGQRVQADVTLTDGQSRDVEVELPAREVTPPPVTPPPQPLPVQSKPTTVSPLVYIGFGTAIVGLGIGTTTGILTLSSAGTLKDTCRDGRCPASAQSDIDSTSTTGTISTIAFTVGAVGLVVGVVGLVIGGNHAAPPQTGLRVVPSGNGVSGSF
jgi:hypothetical protein